jgi:hypothetical protein
VLAADATLKQQRQCWEPKAFVMVIGGDHGYGAVGSVASSRVVYESELIGVTGVS